MTTSFVRTALATAAALLFSAVVYAATPVCIMQLGDSLTAQSDARKALYDQLTADGFTFEFVGSKGAAPLRHEGHSGYTIGPDDSKPGSLFANIDAWIPAAKPDIITVLVGNNDYNGKPGVDPATAPERMTAFLNRLHALAPNATILVSSVLKIAWKDDYAGALNRALPDIVKQQQAAGRRIYFVDLHTEVDLLKGERPYDKPGGDYTDGTHLNASGGKKLADGWYAHLKPLLKP
ncbi:MAG: GDSL-type esterase/lipase family protein [Rariglobus sp.]